MSQPFDDQPHSFLDLEDPGDETTPSDMPYIPFNAQEVPTSQESISFLDMDTLEDEINVNPIAIPLASQWQPSRVNPNGEAAGFQNTHSYVSPLDLENAVDASSVPVYMPRHPRPARVRQARRPIIEVPEPHVSTLSLTTEKLTENIDLTPITVPLSSQLTTAIMHPSINAHVSSSETKKVFRDSDGSRMFSALALGGLFLCALFGVTFLGLGICVSRYRRTLGPTALPPGPWRTSTLPAMYQSYKGVITILPGTNPHTAQIISFALDIMVTLCTESIGYVHSVALRSALAAESQLNYNTDLRLFPPLRFKSWFHPNGTLCNALVALGLIFAYTSSSMAFIQVQSVVYTDGSTTWYSTAVFAEPLIILGMSLLLPAIIAFCSIRKTTILTWSFSPFDMTKALLQAERIARIRGKCMTNVLDTNSTLPRRTLSDRQPSAWESHPNVPIIVWMIWVLALVFALGGVANFCIWQWFDHNGEPGAALMSWALLPNENSNQNDFWHIVDPDTGYPYWGRNFTIVAITQGFLTLGLHGCEVVINVVRDEAQWRLATSPAGMRLDRNALLLQLGSWPNVALLVAKPFLHWIFSLALDFKGFVTPLAADMMSLQINIRTVQIWYLSISILVVAVALTFLAHRRPRGYQPAAYGHIQTLANVVDKWVSTLHWGEKPGRGEAGEFYNTGTDDHPLPQPQISDWFSMV